MRLLAPCVAARRAGLRYMTDSAPGISRQRRGRGFVYVLPTGSLVRGAHQDRIRALAIPPAWTRVWICPLADGHLQATGVDARGRKQYRYHDSWTEVRNRDKFVTLAEFGSLLASIRARVERDLRLPGLPREKVAACVVHLMDRTLIRVGNSEYARDNDSYGLTTIRNSHARVAGTRIDLSFRSKSGRSVRTTVDSPAAARIVRMCQELPGQELFGYLDGEGRARDIGSSDINEYVASVTGRAFTAKDFRTWGGTCAAAGALRASGPPAGADGRPASATEVKRREAAAVRAASEALGNTAAVCRKFYVHPGVLEAYWSGRLDAAFQRAAGARSRRMSLCERAVLLVLKSAASKRAGAAAA